MKYYTISEPIKIPGHHDELYIIFVIIKIKILKNKNGL